MSSMVDDFSDWVNAELESRGWGYSELSRRSGLSVSGISSMMTGQRQPGLDMCKGIARAFGMRPEEVLYQAGLLKRPPPSVLDEERVVDLFRLLNPQDRSTVLTFLSALAEERTPYRTGDHDEN